MIFEFLRTFFKTLANIIGFIFLVSYLSHWFKSDEPEAKPARVPIATEGDCGLPGIVSQSSFITRKKEKTERCVMYVVAPDWEKQWSPVLGSDFWNCKVKNYSIFGHIGTHRFLVGRHHLIFPVWQEESVCVVVLTRPEWAAAAEQQQAELPPVN